MPDRLVARANQLQTHARATTPQRFGAVAASAARPNGTVASRSVHESPRREGKLVRTRAPVPLLGLARPSTSRQTQQARSAAFRGRGAADPSRRPSLSTGLRSQGHKMWTRCGSVGPTGSCMLRVWPGDKHKGTLHEPSFPSHESIVRRGGRPGRINDNGGGPSERFPCAP